MRLMLLLILAMLLPASPVLAQATERTVYASVVDKNDAPVTGVAANEFICICGPSGCGKTTLLDMLAGILKPSQGHILIDGAQADPKQQSISFVFQEPSTLPWLNVRDNIGTGLRIKGARKAEARFFALSALRFSPAQRK